MITEQPLEGKVAMITGGSRGIGAAISRQLAHWGCKLCINYVERDAPAEALRDELSAAGTSVQLLKADIGDPDQVESMFTAFSQQHEGLDILVLNAGSAIYRRLADATTSHWDYVFNTNARSAWLMATNARPLMAGRSATIITISNHGAIAYGSAGGGLMGAAKASVESLTRSMNMELGREGIVVNCVRPGIVEGTDVVERQEDVSKRLAADRKRSPWGRVTTVADCANVVALLCLDEARWIGGQTIVVDGGLSLLR